MRVLLLFVAVVLVLFLARKAGIWINHNQLGKSTPQAERAAQPDPTAAAPLAAGQLSGNHRTVFEQLDALSRRGEDEMAFVIFKDVESKRMVQFAGPHITLDLPISYLDPESQKRARTVFRDYPGTLEYDEGWGPTIQLQLDDDVNLATTITMRVFREVHQLPDDFALRVTTDKD